MCIVFENSCINGNWDTESYSIGKRNVKMMMVEMSGRVCLRFQYKKD